MEGESIAQSSAISLDISHLLANKTDAIDENLEIAMNTVNNSDINLNPSSHNPIDMGLNDFHEKNTIVLTNLTNPTHKKHQSEEFINSDNVKEPLSYKSSFVPLVDSSEKNHTSIIEEVEKEISSEIFEKFSEAGTSENVGAKTDPIRNFQEKIKKTNLLISPVSYDKICLNFIAGIDNHNEILGSRVTAPLEIDSDSNGEINFSVSSPALLTKLNPKKTAKKIHSFSSRLLKLLGSLNVLRPNCDLNKNLSKIIRKTVNEIFLINSYVYRWNDEIFSQEFAKILNLFDQTTLRECVLNSNSFNSQWLNKFYSNYNSIFYKPRFIGNFPNIGLKRFERNHPYVEINTKSQFSEKYLKCISKYPSRNIFSVSFAGIFYRLLPNNILADLMLDGENYANEKIASILCCNSDGSEKMPLWLINSLIEPQNVSRSLARINATIDSHKNYQNLVKTSDSLDSIKTDQKIQEGSSNSKSSKISNKNNQSKKQNTTEVKDEVPNKDKLQESDPSDNFFDDDDPFYFRYNSESCISRTIFLEWLYWFDARVNGRKILLLLDEKYAFPSTEMPFLKNVKLLLVPSNISGSPKNLDLICSWKLNYRLRYYDYLLLKLGLSSTVFNIGIKSKELGFNNCIDPELISLVDTAYLLSDAWNCGVHPNFIISVFKRLQNFAHQIKTGSKHLSESENFSHNKDTFARDDLSFIELENQLDLLNLFFSKFQSQYEFSSTNSVINNAYNKGSDEREVRATFFDYYSIKLYSKFPVDYPKLYKKYKNDIKSNQNTLISSKNSIYVALDLGKLVHYPLEDQVTTEAFDDLALTNMSIADLIFEMRCITRPEKST
ncbi:CENP-B-like protein [Smittium mucronatum]|uniref:CENP-B-like protein n=1 Tax=Smittium mucronatum TaxID=133383 RepID=A0A1R0H4P9_9FUNG|nr:CENP-B-like protein [Smittium mucronatum]